MLTSLKTDIAATRKENSDNFTSLKASISSVEESIKDITKRLTDIEMENKKLKQECDALNTENKIKSEKIFDLQCDVHELQQYTRRSNIEIKGVPKTKEENIYIILEAVAEVIGVQYSRSYISIAHRVNGKQNPIIVQFTSRSMQAEWLAAAKGKRINTRDLRISLESASIYINEHLTAHNKSVLMAAKTLIREHRLAFAWSQGGRIMVRRTAEEKAVRVMFISDVENAALPPRQHDRAGESAEMLRDSRGHPSRTSSSNTP